MADEPKEGDGTADSADNAAVERAETPGSVKAASVKSNSKPGTPASKSRGSAKPPSTPTSKTSARSGGSAKSSRKVSSAKSGKPGSAKSGKPGSAKSSRAGSAKESQSPKPPTETAPSPTKEIAYEVGKAFKAPHRKPKLNEEGEEIVEEGLPPDTVALFLSSKSQEIFACVCDENITEEEPFMLLSKTKIQQDLFDRAAVSDFAPVKVIINDYPEEEILIGYDPEFKYGQNFYLATTVEAKEHFIKPEPDEEGGSGGVDGVDDEEEMVYKYVPPVSKEWVSLGSEVEVNDMTSAETRKPIKMTIKRVRREYGAPCKFVDRNVADAKGAYQECVSYEDKQFDMRKIELETATQAVPIVEDRCSQTDWRYPRNATTQYTPREFNEEEKKQHTESSELCNFMSQSLPRFELAMQQNEILDLFYDDWLNLADNDSSFGTKADNHLKEYQSFTDLMFSKEKMITCIDWHPTIRGIVAVSIAERLTFDERIDQAAKVIMTPSLILIWSFTDPIHPQLLLEAPDDILTFKFCPTDPNIIAGGCINGQLVLWDISSKVDRLKTQRGVKKKSALASIPGFEDQSALEAPIIRYCAVSSIEHSHRSPLTDLLWVPDHMELNRMGIPQENTSGQCVQIMTCAVDHPSTHSDWLTRIRDQSREESASKSHESEEDKQRRMEEREMNKMAGVVLCWDTRPPKIAAQQDKKAGQLHNPMGVPTTFKHLDLTWKPILKVSLYKSEPGGDHSPCKFTIQEKQGDKSALDSAEDTAVKQEGFSSGVGGFGKPGSGKKTLKSINTHFYVGTEDGEMVYVDWLPQKDQDSGKIQTPKPNFYHTKHDGPITTLQRSPFFRNILLSVGGWNFAIWKEGVTTGPILCSNASSQRLTAGHWSPSRPAVFYITKHDGTVDVWDLLDRTHEPSMTQNVSPTTISYIVPHKVTSKQHLLAVGDGAGTLHILEIPWSLRQPTPNELAGVSNYFDREVKRQVFVMVRWDFREKEKIAHEQELKMKAGIAPQVILTEEEKELRLKLEYQQYLEDEGNFLRELGLKEDPEEPLPSTD